MKKTKAVILIIMICMCICACRNSTDNENIDSNNIEGQNVDLYKLGDSLIYSHSLILSYATEFAVDYYIPYDCENDNTGDNVFRLITIANDGRFLVVPDLSASTEYNMDELVNGIPDDIKIITSPKQIYLVASQVMDMFAAIGAMDTLRFSALRTEDWYISEAVEYMEQGKLIYAGKYSAPDYELILEQGCDLVIENTMIYHTQIGRAHV